MNRLIPGPIRAVGEILIDPPIPAADLVGSEFVQTGRSFPYLRDLRLVVVEQPVDTEQGTLLRREAIAVVPAGGVDEGHRLLRDLQQIVDDYGAGRTFTGRLNLTCLDDLTQSRVKVVDGVAVQFHPTVTWPGDSA